MFTFKTQPQSIWSVMADGLRLYRAGIMKVWYWQIIFFLPAVLLSLVDTLINPDADLPFTPLYISFLVVTLLISAVASIGGHCFTFSRMHAVGVHGDTSIKSSMLLALNKILPVFGAAVVFFLVLLLICAPIYYLFASVQSVLVAFIGLALVYAVVLCGGIFCLLFPLFILFENKGVFSSLRNSMSHIAGNFWRTLTMFFILSLVGMLVVYALILPLQLLAFFGDSSVALVIGIIGIFLAYIAIYAFVLPVYTAMLLALYHDVKVRKALDTAVVSQ